MFRAFMRMRLVGMFPRNRYRDPSARIPPIVRRRDVACGWPLGVTILAVVKTVFGGSWNAEGRTKAIALYIGAAAKRARIKFHVTHFPGSAMLADAAAGENIERLRESPLGFPPICAPAQFNA
jgi:hypothetical protein